MSGESYDLHLTTLSPIHIGSGKSYSCCEFVPAKAKRTDCQNNKKS